VAFLSVEYEDHVFAGSPLISLVPGTEVVEGSRWRAEEGGWCHLLRPIRPEHLERQVRSVSLYVTFTDHTLQGEILLDDMALWAWRGSHEPVSPAARLKTPNFQKPVPPHTTDLRDAGEPRCVRKVFQNYRLPEVMVDPSRDLVTLATQLSVDRIDHLVMQAKNWEGPLSVALYVPEALEKHAAQVIRELVAAEENIRRYAKIHLVLERGDGCLFPINFLRNVAMVEAVTPYVLILDVDLLPSTGSTRAISKEIKNYFSETPAAERDRTVFVVPAFELQHSPVLPMSKEMVIARLEEGTVAPFLFQKKVASQFSTNYAAWARATRPYAVIPSDQYEPFVVVPSALKDTVLFDDNLAGYGLNKVLFTAALVRGGFTMQVLAHSYAVHLGHKPSEAKVAWTADPLVRLRQHHYQQAFIRECQHQESPPDTLAA